MIFFDVAIFRDSKLNGAIAKSYRQVAARTREFVDDFLPNRTLRTTNNNVLWTTPGQERFRVVA